MDNVKKVLDVCDWFKLTFESAIFLMCYYRYEYLETHKDADYQLLITCAKNGFNYEEENAFLSDLTRAENWVYVWSGRDKIAFKSLRPLAPRIFERVGSSDMPNLKNILKGEKLPSPFENFQL